MSSAVSASQPSPVPAPEGPLPVGSGRQVWTPRPSTDAEARALASGLRLRILRLALHEAMTNKEIAERLGRPPASVLHHVRTLVAHGFLVPQAARTGRRGAREVPYLASGKSFYVYGPAQTGVLEAFLAEVAEVPSDELDITRLGLMLDDDEVVELRGRLEQLTREYAARPPTPGGGRWSLHVVLHPEKRPG